MEVTGDLPCPDFCGSFRATGKTCLLDLKREEILVKVQQGLCSHTQPLSCLCLPPAVSPLAIAQVRCWLSECFKIQCIDRQFEYTEANRSETTAIEETVCYSSQEEGATPYYGGPHRDGPRSVRRWKKKQELWAGAFAMVFAERNW